LTRKEALKLIADLLVELEGVQQEIDEDTRIEELPMDSLALLNFGATLEERCDVLMNDREFLDYETIGDVIDWLCN
jgi:acyl carrier protein